MEKFNFIVDVMNNGPIERMESFVHEEFLFFKEYGMQDRGEWLSEIRELVEGDWQFKEPNLVAENEDVLVFNHIVLDEPKISSDRGKFLKRWANVAPLYA